MSDHAYPPGIHRPEWETVLVDTGQKTRPVGDPTVWGGTITTAIDTDPVLGSTPRVISGGQIVLAQAADRYTRSWSIVGVLRMPFGTTGIPSPDVQPPGFVETSPVTPTTPSMTVWLRVNMGVERISLLHDILLFTGDQAQNFGLCWNQNSANGGPYGAEIVQPLVPGSTVDLPFACIGALIGKMLSIQAIYVRGPNVAAETYPEITITAMVTPYAPGAGI